MTHDQVQDDEIVLRHIPGFPSHQAPPAGRITTINFRLRPDETGYSVSRAVLTTPDQLVARRSGYRLPAPGSRRPGSPIFVPSGSMSCQHLSPGSTRATPRFGPQPRTPTTRGCSGHWRACFSTSDRDHDPASHRRLAHPRRGSVAYRRVAAPCLRVSLSFFPTPLPPAGTDRILSQTLPAASRAGRQSGEHLIQSG